MTHYCISPGCPHRGAWTHTAPSAACRLCGPPRALVTCLVWHPVTRQRSGGRLAARASRGRASGSSEHGPHHTQSGLRRCLRATQLPNRVPQSVTPVLSGLHTSSLELSPRECEFRRGETLGLGTGIDWGVPRLRRTRVRSRRFSKKRSSLARPEHRPARWGAS